MNRVHSRNGQGIEIVVTKDIDKKLATRPLYEQAFEDPKGFVDYYYTEKISDNTMVLALQSGQIVSMLHLNPYTIVVNGREEKVYYIVAVATDRAFRRQGYMAEVLQASFREMQKEGIPFCFLLPVDEAIYRDFGFQTVCPFFARLDTRSALSYEEVQRSYEVYCKQDELYCRRRAAEDALADKGDTELLPENPVIMARVTDESACAKLLGCPQGSSSMALLQALSEKRCFFREEV